jgi:hypothetical protein
MNASIASKVSVFSTMRMPLGAPKPILARPRDIPSQTTSSAVIKASPESAAAGMGTQIVRCVRRKGARPPTRLNED